MRKNYFDLIATLKVDPSIEFRKINEIFEEEIWDSKLGRISLFGFVTLEFKLYKNRGHILSLNELYKYVRGLVNNRPILDKLFCFCEMYIDLLKIPSIKSHEGILQQAKHMINQITYVVNAFNHEIKEIKGHSIIVEANPFASEAAQIVADYEDINEALSILEYNHFFNKGNIERKKEILIKLAGFLEAWREELKVNDDLKAVFKVDNKKIIVMDKLFRMYNEMNIRHNNSRQRLDDLPLEEIETWYDKIYTMSLFVILGKDISQILADFRELEDK